MKRFIRKLITRAVEPLGYVVDGNHIFTGPDYAAIIGGKWRASVSERPEKHGARVVRAAGLLARTF